MRVALLIILLATSTATANVPPKPWATPVAPSFPGPPSEPDVRDSFDDAKRAYDQRDFATALDLFTRLAHRASTAMVRDRAARAAVFAFVEVGKSEHLVRFVEQLDRSRFETLAELGIALYATTGRFESERVARRAYAARLPGPAACEQRAEVFVAAIQGGLAVAMTAVDELVAALPTGSATCRARAAERIGWYVQVLFHERHHPDPRLARLAWIALALAVDHDQIVVAGRIALTLAWDHDWMLRRELTTVQRGLVTAITGGACAAAAC